MMFNVILAAVLVASASGLPGILHDDPHHTEESLRNIHDTPICAYSCIFHDSYPGKFAPECVGKEEEGKGYGACLCRANAYQYMLDQCVAIKCGKDDKAREAVRPFIWKVADLLRRGRQTGRIASIMVLIRRRCTSSRNSSKRTSEKECR